MGAAEPTHGAGVRDTARPVGVYRPRRPRASPLYRLLEDHFREFTTVYDERFARRWGYWRPIVAAVVEKYLACGILEHGFAPPAPSPRSRGCAAGTEVRAGRPAPHRSARGEATVGRVAAAPVRGGAVALSPMRGSDADRGVHHHSTTHRPHPRASPAPGGPTSPAACAAEGTAVRRVEDIRVSGPYGDAGFFITQAGIPPMPSEILRGWEGNSYPVCLRKGARLPAPRTSEIRTSTRRMSWAE